MLATKGPLFFLHWNSDRKIDLKALLSNAGVERGRMLLLNNKGRKSNLYLFRGKYPLHTVRINMENLELPISVAFHLFLAMTQVSKSETGAPSVDPTCSHNTLHILYGLPQNGLL